MTKLFLKQIKNLFREFGLLHGLQLLLVLIVVLAYLIIRSVDLINYAEQHLGLTPVELALFWFLACLLSLFISAPFILLYLVPKQKEIIVFYTLPLSRTQLFGLLSYYYQKYQLVLLALFLVPPAAMIFLYPIIGIVLMFSLLFIAAALHLFFIGFFSGSVSSNRFKASSFSLLIIFILLSFFTFYFFGWPGPALTGLLFLAILAITGYKYLTKHRRPDLALLYPLCSSPYLSQKEAAPSRVRVFRILPMKMQALFKAYILMVWRNPQSRRLKLITLLSYIVLLNLLRSTLNGDVYMWLTLAGMLFIYLHYSNYFNKKYVLPEADWFFLTLPHRYWHIWSAKFFAESLFIILLLLCHWLFLLFWGVGFQAQLHLLGLLFLFSLFTVSAMLNFQILFYDDPRLGGYAYHFMILLILVMSVNYRLVGPVLGVFLLGLNFYKSYKYFNA